MTRPLATGDPVTLILNGQPHPARVLALSRWAWILLQGSDARLYVDVVFNHSATSWSRLVRLSPDISAKDHAMIDRIARDLAHRPRRSDVADVAGAEMLLPVHDRIEQSSQV